MWTLITITWMFGFGLGIGLGCRWTKESQRLDRAVEEALGDADGLYVDRGRFYRENEPW